ncbi:alpha/beta fold hydrolase [Sphingomonas sp. PAMC 26621]|uniref:alpha/beta fold hydrolase n=1 Tax=Sphingomonas sp. PAMC 26621 TaxID=1112213 RepID=UPI001EE66F03|nr:alpha/beta hydrolase [Sphingomonas sp. PAMC 26621]
MLPGQGRSAFPLLGNVRRVGRAVGRWIGLSLMAGSAALAAAPGPDHEYDAYSRPTVPAKLSGARSIGWVCIGTGFPTVVLTAGAGDWSVAWRKVQPAIATTTRVCAWDRPGFGFSSPSSDVQDLAHTEADLEAALSAADIRGPYVLVGHSMGAYETLRFTDRNRRNVAGIVLVDPAFPDQFRRLARDYPGVFKLQSSINIQNSRDLLACADGVRSGSIKPGSAVWSDCVGADPTYPAELHQRLARLATDPGRFTTQWSFTTAEFGNAEQVIDPRRRYGDLPLIVLTAADTPDFPASVAPASTTAEMKRMQVALWTKAHDRLAALSSRGENIIVGGSMHYIQLMKPDAVIAATMRVIAEARTARNRRGR